jgi:hypothetical protein
MSKATKCIGQAQAYQALAAGEQVFSNTVAAITTAKKADGLTFWSTEPAVIRSKPDAINC